MGQELFGHDTEFNLQFAAALVNTGPSSGQGGARGPGGAGGRGVDLLSSQDELDAFCERWEVTGSRTHDAAELLAVQRLRPALREAWSLDRDELAGWINDMLHRHRALPQLVRHDGWDYHFHATDADRPVAVRSALDVAMALAELVRAGAQDRLRVCDAGDCDDVFVDLSKNAARRFCSTRCGNRMAAAQSRARRRAG